MKTSSHIICNNDHRAKTKKAPTPIHFNEYQIREFIRNKCHNSYREAASFYVEYEQNKQYTVQDREHLRAFILQKYKFVTQGLPDETIIDKALTKANMCAGNLFRITGDRQLDLIIVAGFIVDEVMKEDK